MSTIDLVVSKVLPLLLKAAATNFQFISVHISMGTTASWKTSKPCLIFININISAILYYEVVQSTTSQNYLYLSFEREERLTCEYLKSVFECTKCTFYRCPKRRVSKVEQFFWILWSSSTLKLLKMVPNTPIWR
jgi:hypothetical protein